MMAGTGVSRARLNTDDDALRGRLRCGKRCRVAVRSSAAVAGLGPARNALGDAGA